MKKNLILILCAIGIQLNTVAMPQPHLPSMPKPKGIPRPPKPTKPPSPPKMRAIQTLLDKLREPAVQNVIKRFKKLTPGELAQHRKSFKDIPGLQKAVEGVKNIPIGDIVNGMVKVAVLPLKVAGELGPKTIEQQFMLLWILTDLLSMF